MGAAVYAKTKGWRGALVVLVALSAAAVVLVAQSPAGAHDHRVPRVVLMEGNQELQAGRKVDEYSWTRPAGDGTCVHENAILIFRLPREAPTVTPGSKLRVRIFKAQKPRSFELVETDENGRPTREMDIELRPVVREDRTVAWDAVFRADRPNSEYMMKATGQWRDREGCGPADQFASWSFHVKTGEPA